ncbi:MAG: twin-arginine translocase subunit TatC [Acidimicrobiia bacterium]
MASTTDSRRLTRFVPFSRRRVPEGRMTVVEHLSELRRRLVISIVAVVIAGIVVFILSPEIISFLVKFYTDATDRGSNNALIFTGPLDAFATRLKIATYGGIVLAMPVWLYQLWRFITPGLSPKERRYAVPFVLTSIVLFVIGGVVALLTLEPALNFLLNIGGSDLKPLLAADRYVSLVSLMIVAFGLSFEFPVILMFLLLANIITTQRLRDWRRYAIVLIVLFAAVITPSQDPYSLFAMAVPMYLFYEGVIVIGRLLKR